MMYDIIVFENLRFRPSGIGKRETGVFKNLHSLKTDVFGDGFRRNRMDGKPNKRKCEDEALNRTTQNCQNVTFPFNGGSRCVNCISRPTWVVPIRARIHTPMMTGTSITAPAVISHHRIFNRAAKLPHENRRHLCTFYWRHCFLSHHLLKVAKVVNQTKQFFDKNSCFIIS